MPAYAEVNAEADALIVARLKEAGAIPLTRTNLPDLGLRVHTDSYSLRPDPESMGCRPERRRLERRRGLGPRERHECLGLGNDIGGSLRIPAQCNGIASLKPTLGRIASPTGGEMSGQLMAVNGPMARRVADLRTAYELLGRYHRSDPWSVPVPIDLERPASPVKVALVPEPSGGTTHPDIAAGVRAAARP